MGGVKRCLDFNKLKQELSPVLLDESKERYEFTWPDKKLAKVNANTPINKTLRPARDESVDFDNTQNLYIEGDNLEVLKLLRNTYLGKVKMIYIDPPYNTGTDLIYDDDFRQSEEKYNQSSGDFDEEGNCLVTNSTSNGRFHTNWLNMIYPRLKLAKDLLSNDGIFFISIDDHEQANLKKVCDEIFGDWNFIACIIVDGTPKNDPNIISTSHEYCLAYVKNKECAKNANYGVSNPLYEELLSIFNTNGTNYEKTSIDLNNFYNSNHLTEDNIANYKYVDKKGIYRTGPIDDPQSSGPTDQRKNPKTGKNCATPTRGWSCTIETWNQWVKDELIEFPDTDDKLPSKKTYISEGRLDVLRAYIKIQTRKDTDMLKKLFQTEYPPFPNPKPLEFIKNLINVLNDKDALILDFFSGSGTTAHAVMDLNKLDYGRRKYILVQYQESIKEKKSSSTNKQKKIISTALDFLDRNNLDKNICEIGKERIRRAGKKIKEESPTTTADLDIGFRVLKVDSSNMEDVFYTPDKYDQKLLDNIVDNIKPNRSSEDLLFQVLLDMGVSLSSRIERKKINKAEVFYVYAEDEKFLIACFDKNISDEVVTKIAKEKPTYFVMRDIGDDCVKINFEQIFSVYSPDTIRKSL